MPLFSIYYCLESILPNSFIERTNISSWGQWQCIINLAIMRRWHIFIYLNANYVMTNHENILLHIFFQCDLSNILNFICKKESLLKIPHIFNVNLIHFYKYMHQIKIMIVNHTSCLVLIRNIFKIKEFSLPSFQREIKNHFRT